MSPVDTDEQGSTSVVLRGPADDLHLYRILLANRTGYQLNNAE
jgi:hypothetical protein